MSKIYFFIIYVGIMHIFKRVLFLQTGFWSDYAKLSSLSNPIVLIPTRLRGIIKRIATI